MLVLNSLEVLGQTDDNNNGNGDDNSGSSGGFLESILGRIPILGGIITFPLKIASGVLKGVSMIL